MPETYGCIKISFLILIILPQKQYWLAYFLLKRREMCLHSVKLSR